MIAISMLVVLGTSIELNWQSGGKLQSSFVVLDTLAQVEREQPDVQYDRVVRSKGVPLAALLAQLPGEGDLVVARFQNGMQVPLPDAEGLERLGAFVAVSVWADGAWAAPPPLYKPGARDRDWRPTRFAGNKLMVTQRWFPGLADPEQAAFTPWLHVNALAGLERTSREALARLYPPGKTAGERRGRELFDRRCSVCHGARGQGASFGWDFVEPVPLHSYRGPESLFMHVRYRASDAPEKGYMMPQLSDLTRDDAKALWQWMRLLTESGPRPSGL